MKRRLPISTLAGLVMMTAGLLSAPLTAALAEDARAFEARYVKEMVPLIVRYCSNCHEGDDAEAEVDLSIFKSVTDLRQHARVWQQVLHMLESGQMSPHQSKQPSESERRALQTWINTFLKTEAKAHAGDPGRVVLRRLSSAEYAYTLRDLTGTADWLKVNQFYTEQLAYIAAKLDAIQEGERTLLDNSMIMYCSSMMTGNHNTDQLPVVVLGRGGGRIKTGQVISDRNKPERQMCRLFLSMMDKMDVHPGKFGDAKQPLDEI